MMKKRMIVLCGLLSLSMVTGQTFAALAESTDTTNTTAVSGQEQTPPEMPDGQPPEKPDGEMGEMPDGQPPEKPDGEMGEKPDGQPPEKPDGEMGEMPDGTASRRKNRTGRWARCRAARAAPADRTIPI